MYAWSQSFLWFYISSEILKYIKFCDHWVWREQEWGRGLVVAETEPRASIRGYAQQLFYEREAGLHFMFGGNPVGRDKRNGSASRTLTSSASSSRRSGRRSSGSSTPTPWRPWPSSRLRSAAASTTKTRRSSGSSRPWPARCEWRKCLDDLTLTLIFCLLGVLWDWYLLLPTPSL